MEIWGIDIFWLSLMGCSRSPKNSAIWSVHLAGSWCQVATTGTTTQYFDCEAYIRAGAGCSADDISSQQSRLVMASALSFLSRRNMA